MASRPAHRERTRPTARLGDVVRHLVIAAVSALAAFLLTSATGCGTDAKGIEDCRDIELERCEAAIHCGILTDVDECKRFYRDHCLHGLAVEPPPRNLVDECVAMIERAGACVQANGNVELDECPGISRETILADTACDLVRFPERADECSFLLPTPLDPGPPPAEAGAGGEPGTGNGESGSGGDGAGGTGG
jgi:hypothetical protein